VLRNHAFHFHGPYRSSLRARRHRNADKWSRKVVWIANQAGRTRKAAYPRLPHLYVGHRTSGSGRLRCVLKKSPGVGVEADLLPCVAWLRRSVCHGTAGPTLCQAQGVTIQGLFADDLNGTSTAPRARSIGSGFCLWLQIRKDRAAQRQSRLICNCGPIPVATGNAMQDRIASV
jgi:hypothetical protein